MNNNYPGYTKEKMIIGKQFVEDQYSEKLYSTGNDLLDDLLEKAFCEGYELGQKEFGRTGLTAQQANQFFTKTNKQTSKAIKNAALNKEMNGHLGYDFSRNEYAFVPGSPTANLGPNRRVAQGWGNASNLDYLKGSSYGGKKYARDGYRHGGSANPVDLSINKKAGLATAGAYWKSCKSYFSKR